MTVLQMPVFGADSEKKAAPEKPKGTNVMTAAEMFERGDALYHGRKVPKDEMAG